MKIFNYTLTFLEILGIIETISWLAVLVFGVWGIIRGFLPVIIRLGKGLSKRKIAIFAKGDRSKSLEDLLLDSNLFKQKNIKSITSIGDIGKAESVTVFLVFWDDWKTDINRILEKKKDNTALIIYAPVNSGDIPQAQMRQISEQRNVTVTRFRGRLLNDIVISMITTTYNKKGN